MKCKCRNNSRFPQFTVGKTYPFKYEDKYKIFVRVLTDDNKELRTDVGNFLFSFDPIQETGYYISTRDIDDFEQEREERMSGYKSSMVDPTCPIF